MLSIRNLHRILLKEMYSPQRDFKNNDELIHLNGAKYINFLMSLSNHIILDHKELTIAQKATIQYKHTLQRIGHCLKDLAREKIDDAMTTHSFGYFFVQVAREVANDYSLLELYRIHILDKLGNNSLIRTTNLERLFEKYKKLKAENLFKTVKVLNYNTHFSMFLSWWLAVRIPFVRVIEMSAYNEEIELVNSVDNYYSHETNTDDVFFEELDKKLRDDFFQFLNIPDYEVYRNLAAEKLVQIQSLIQNLFSTNNKGTENALSSGYKPLNYEYSSDSLQKIPSESISLITTRDLKLQLTPLSYPVILREFYRILEFDGVLEISLFITDSFESAKNKTFFSLDCFKYNNINLCDYFDGIPNFFETVLDELQKIFGRENVKHNITTLNEFDNLGKYLAEVEIFSTMEIAGLLPLNEGESLGKSLPEDEINLLVSIVAHKHS